MPADITRNSFDPAKAFTRVIKQQGRVDLDADFNEQTDILIAQQRTFVRDVLGPFCAIDGAFRVTGVEGPPPDLSVAPGNCYVNGILVATPDQPVPLLFSNQPFPDAVFNPDWPDGDFIVFLDVHERIVTSVDDSSLLDSALGGADTSARSQVIWQIKIRPVVANAAVITAVTYDKPGEAGQIWQRLITNELAPGMADLTLPTARLSARARYDAADPDAPPGQASMPRYRGAANRLYRIEIHTGGPESSATFKWSRDNASTAHGAKSTGKKSQFKLEALKLAGARRLKPGDWMEICDVQAFPGGGAKHLACVSDFNPVTGVVTFAGDTIVANSRGIVALRKWDQRTPGGAAGFTGAVAVQSSRWIPLEDGVEIRFEPGCIYRAGEYWHVPARVDSADVIWPQVNGSPMARPAIGGHHHYAPLAIVKRQCGKFVSARTTRRVLQREQLAKPDYAG